MKAFFQFLYFHSANIPFFLRHTEINVVLFNKQIKSITEQLKLNNGLSEHQWPISEPLLPKKNIAIFFLFTIKKTLCLLFEIASYRIFFTIQEKFTSKKYFHGHYQNQKKLFVGFSSCPYGNFSSKTIKDFNPYFDFVRSPHQDIIDYLYTPLRLGKISDFLNHAPKSNIYTIPLLYYGSFRSVLLLALRQLKSIIYIFLWNIKSPHKYFRDCIYDDIKTGHSMFAYLVPICVNNLLKRYSISSVYLPFENHSWETQLIKYLNMKGIESTQVQNFAFTKNHFSFYLSENLFRNKSNLPFNVILSGQQWDFSFLRNNAVKIEYIPPGRLKLFEKPINFSPMSNNILYLGSICPNKVFKDIQYIANNYNCSHTNIQHLYLKVHPSFPVSCFSKQFLDSIPFELTVLHHLPAIEFNKLYYADTSYVFNVTDMFNHCHYINHSDRLSLDPLSTVIPK